MQRYEQSKLTSLSRDEFVELGESMLAIANRQFATPCVADVRCFTVNTRLGEDSTMDMLPLEVLARDDNANTRRRFTHIADIAIDDMQRQGLIQISISPIDETKAPAFAWAVINTRGDKNSVSAYIQGSHGDMAADTLKPLAQTWDKQNPVTSLPRRWLGVLKQALA